MPRTDVIATLARWALTCLASSMVLAITILVLMFMLSDIPSWIRRNPVGVAVIAGFLAGYIVSFSFLRKARESDTNGNLLFWLISLAGTCVPLAGLAYWSKNISVALAIGILESVAVLLHLVAIAIILVRRHAA
ncbi:MAG: hypothetical protein V4709_11505 [Pseudomonadota bacterium]